MVWITPTDSVASVVSNSIILVVSSSIKGSWTSKVSRLDSVKDTVPPLRFMYLLYSSDQTYRTGNECMLFSSRSTYL